ncbi:DUF5675 family protein [Phocaeicola massiliensis]|jgi:hypothetical protein|uniref:L,D-transpeptidase catalytic domain n=1 Tax=Siphoviridae sp. ctvBz3 TaxID=2825720 RepID=A0A8S5TXI3_9CAUD|nr:MAG TPA: L,D-transpeptidase catalytic domain [Siphoviridae sp. ctvBz3]DAX44120.1 MAG TPA: L,D-transpeptidase catalytic domain [Caudoviricetes sp.]DAY78695.1 MAG TPA: L,D-transpeptidase catalytic domain [Caudoviricetes sp.]
MKLRVERLWKKPAYTVGRLFVDGKFFCNTLEDTVRDLSNEKKVYGKTAIPYGEYKVVYNWSPKFGRNLPRLLNVPAFEGILIHPGNTADDSAGCILVGRNTEVGRLTESRYTSDKLNVLIEDAQRRGESITIEIV